MKSVCYISGNNGACDYYRAELPWRTAKRNGVDVRRAGRGESVDKNAIALDADAILFQRPDNEPTLEAMMTLQKQGRTIVVDYDDNLLSVSPFSPHYEDFGTQDVTVESHGKTIHLWQDGINGFNTVANAHRLECVKAACAMADVVTVTTDIISKVYGEYNRNVKVLPNCVDPDLWQSLPLPKKDVVRLYWSGGASHFEDFALIANPLKIVMEKYPQTRLVLMGQTFQGTIKDLPQDRIELHTWVDMAAYPYKSVILNADISLIPLVDNDFNACKSSLKLVEQSMLGIPSVVSYVSPYKEDYNGHNAVMVEGNSEAGWIKALSTLIEDSLLRQQIGMEAQKVAMVKYNIHNNWHKWVDAYGLNS